MLSRPYTFAAIVLAAGQSHRYTCGNKLLARLGSKPLVSHCLETLLGLGLSRVIVVTGFESDLIEAAICPYTVDFVHNPQFARGLGTSLAAGVAAVPQDVDAAFICLADMPAIEPNVFEAMCAAFQKRPSQDICVPVVAGQTGHPVLFGRRHFSKLRALTGDRGARLVITSNPELVQAVNVSTSSILLDCDTRDDFSQASAG